MGRNEFEKLSEEKKEDGVCFGNKGKDEGKEDKGLKGGEVGKEKDSRSKSLLRGRSDELSE